LGERKPALIDRLTFAGRRSTVTIFWTDARLFEASAVQTVIRYGPSAAGDPASFLPSHVKTTFLPTRLPERTAFPAIPPANGWTI